MRVNVETRPAFAASTPAVAVDGVPLTNGGAWSYDLYPDGRRLLIIREPFGTHDPNVAAPNIVVVQNWLDELKRLVPIN